jgi:hypothetical protein
LIETFDFVDEVYFAASHVAHLGYCSQISVVGQVVLHFGVSHY